MAAVQQPLFFRPTFVGEKSWTPWSPYLVPYLVLKRWFSSFILAFRISAQIFNRAEAKFFFPNNT
jgi:hypothetical protein